LVSYKKSISQQNIDNFVKILIDDEEATQADPEFLMYRAKGGKSLKVFHASIHGDIFFQNFSIQPLNNANIASPRKIIQKERNNLMSPIEKDISDRNMAGVPEINLKESYTANLWGLLKRKFSFRSAEYYIRSNSIFALIT